jgi:hypothetical protein
MLTLSRAVRNKHWIIATWSITTLLCSAAYSWGGDGPANQEIQVGHQGLILESDALVAGHEDQSLPHRTASLWQYGAYLDLSYILNFNFPENHLFRSRGTTPRTNEFAPNMALGYFRKDEAVHSRWGMEFGMQAGYDTNISGFGQDRPLISSADTLRHFAYANVTYLAPVGEGLTVRAGLFDSFIGYESLYAAKNSNYTRSWLADNSPYKMFGLMLKYPVRTDLSLGFTILNGYWYLTNPNDQPSYVLHASWQVTKNTRFTQNLYYGPDQRSTSLRYWRFFSNSMLELKDDQTTIALLYDVGTEKLLDEVDHHRSIWTGPSVLIRHSIIGPWSVALRPELYWDEDGRQTGFSQFVQAMTTTLEYKISVPHSGILLRLEHRYDRSTGRQGGFFKGGEVSPGVIGLARDQHLLIFALMLNWDSR